MNNSFFNESGQIDIISNKTHIFVRQNDNILKLEKNFSLSTIVAKKSQNRTVFLFTQISHQIFHFENALKFSTKIKNTLTLNTTAMNVTIHFPEIKTSLLFFHSSMKDPPSLLCPESKLESNINCETCDVDYFPGSSFQSHDDEDLDLFQDLMQ